MRYVSAVAKLVYHYLQWGPSTIYNRIKMKARGVTFQKGFRCYGRVWMSNRGKIFIGSNVKLRSSARSNPIGIGNRVFLQVMPGAILKIGNNVSISNAGITCAERITIDDGAMIGGGVCIWDTDFHSTISAIRNKEISNVDKPKTEEVYIGKKSFIGAGSIILKGVRIGDESVIGAGSVVTKNIPSKEIWAGNPAKFVRKCD